MSEKPVVIFVLGGPGAGKSTQCGYLVKDYGYVHLSAGDLLRIEMEDVNSPDGQMIRDYIADGKIVPAVVTIALLRKAIDASPTKKFLIDGFPRNEENNSVFEKMLLPHINLPHLLFFDCPEDIRNKRLLCRSGHSGRHDDNSEVIEKRNSVFREQSLPVIEYYRKQGKVIDVPTHLTKEEVRAEIAKVFDELKKKGL
eukprot:TRINITY_DN8169_c0_g1_i1.p1 TRINITY_DN8169_c0_g1~~TRINITY_DN8169_c0_g1_i1.p1  ORF type:complete len:205 (+),score=46.48 TRINITY_DN8169_c0_g1_i1:24-617(+)